MSVTPISTEAMSGLYGGFTEIQARWGVSQTWGSLLLQGGHYESTYTEGRDAGSLTLKGSTVVLDGTVFGNAYAGPRQIVDAATGTARRASMATIAICRVRPSQLPSGGFLLVQALSSNTSGTQFLIGGGDIELVSQANYHPVDPSLAYGQSVSIDANGNLVVPGSRSELAASNRTARHDQPFRRRTILHGAERRVADDERQDSPWTPMPISRSPPVARSRPWQAVR